MREDLTEPQARQASCPTDVANIVAKQAGAASPTEGRRYFARLIEPFLDPSSRSSAVFFAFRRMWE
jgi:hypothetical protein